MVKSIYPCIWFDGQAKAAAEFYSTVFPATKITTDTPMVVNFELDGQKIMCLNGGPEFKVNPSISFMVMCESADEATQAWNKVVEGGHVLMPFQEYPWSEKYGWVQDRFGVSWQLIFGKMQDLRQKITPSLLFTGKKESAEDAIGFYTDIFEGSGIVTLLKYGPGEHQPEGTVKYSLFHLGKNDFVAMDGGDMHQFSFNEGLSFVVECESQEEIDFFWNRLTEGGKESMCGWLTDRFGVSWQVIPAVLKNLMGDPQKAPRVMQAFLKMKKFDIGKLMEA